jgi:acetolactate synthase-1/2/3 large subunit
MTLLEDALGIPVVGMESPRGTADPALGAFAQMLAMADRVLLLGKRLDFTLKFGRPPAMIASCEFSQVDPDAAEIERTRRAVGARLVGSAVADVAPALDLLTRLAKPVTSAWRDEVREAIRHRPAVWDTAIAREPGRLHPVQALRPLQRLLDAHTDSVLVSDGGEFGQWAQACLSAPRRIINGPAGSIGSALPFAAAAKLAHPSATVVAMLGDGTLGFHLSEIDTAVRYGLDYVAVIGNDATWNAEYQIQLRAYGKERAQGCELLPTRYGAVAQALGAHGEDVVRPGEFQGALQRAVASGKPACVNVMIERLAAPKY